MEDGEPTDVGEVGTFARERGDVEHIDVSIFFRDSTQPKRRFVEKRCIEAAGGQKRVFKRGSLDVVFGEDDLGNGSLGIGPNQGKEVVVIAQPFSRERNEHGWPARSPEALF